MASALVGSVKYYGGSSGTVSLSKSEALLAIRAVGASGAYVTINGGDQVPIPASSFFEDRVDSRKEEWVGPLDIIFHATTSYFVKTLVKRGS